MAEPRDASERVAASGSSILVVGPSWVGDMVMAQSLFKTLKTEQPGCAIDVLAPAWSRPLLARMPEVRDAIDMPLGHGELGLGARRRLGHSLRGAGYRQAIVLPNSFKSALTPFWAKIPRRTGFVGECRWGLLNDARRLDKAALPMTVQRFVALGLPDSATHPPQVPPPVLEVKPDGVASALERLEIVRPERLLVLCPGAEYGPAKRWPAAHFAEVAREKIADGWTVWLMGSEKDAPITVEIAGRVGASACVDLAGRTRLAEALDLMSLADHVVTNDSGLMHVAAALGRSLTAVYGSSDPGFTPPLSEDATILRLGLECSPCFKRECPLGHLKCLQDLEPGRVLATIEDASARAGGG